MNIGQKILLGASGLGVLILAYLGLNYFFGQDPFYTNPENITADYQKLLADAEQLKILAGNNCDNKSAVNSQIRSLEQRLAELSKRKQKWLDNVPPLPEAEPELLGGDGSQVPDLTPDVPPLPDFEPELLGGDGSQVPELTSDVPPLPDFEPELLGDDGSQVPELSSDVPPLPEIEIDVIDGEEYIPELPEINTGRPGHEVPELTPDVPPLPDIEADIIDPNEYIFQMEDYQQKILRLLQELKELCADDESQDKKVISDKCSDACQRHKDCSAYTEDATPADLNDAYITCMEECATWPKEMIKCINSFDIKKPNDCVGFLQCQLPQFYEEKYIN